MDLPMRQKPTESKDGQGREAGPAAIPARQRADARRRGWWFPGNGMVRSGMIGEIRLPDFPSNIDWGLKLVYERTLPMPKHF